MPDPIELLKEDHRKAELLFAQFGDGHFGTVQKIIEELEVHTSLEEEFVYPALREAVGGAFADEATHDHRHSEELLERLKSLPPDGPEAHEVMEKLRRDVEQHVAREEEELLPRLADAVSGDRLAEIGGQLAGRKRELTSESTST